MNINFWIHFCLIYFNISCVQTIFLVYLTELSQELKVTGVEETVALRHQVTCLRSHIQSWHRRNVIQDCPTPEFTGLATPPRHVNDWSKWWPLQGFPSDSPTELVTHSLLLSPALCFGWACAQGIIRGSYPKTWTPWSSHSVQAALLTPLLQALQRCQPAKQMHAN